jgi:hypothetical protein
MKLREHFKPRVRAAAWRDACVKSLARRSTRIAAFGKGSNLDVNTIARPFA